MKRGTKITLALAALAALGFAGFKAFERPIALALFEQAVHRLRQEVANGLPLSTAMNASHLFPSLAVQLCVVGETSGRLDDMLDKTASHYETTIDQMLDTLASLLEPLIVLILGVLVGGLVIAMYLPIFQLGDVI